MKKTAWLAMAVLLSCVACTAKEEKEKEHKDKSVKEHIDNSIEEDFRRLDANHNGSITKDEITKDGSPVLQANFDQFDANRDGKLSLQETTAFVLTQRELDTRKKNEAFQRMDANHDGGISKEEAGKENDPFLFDNFDAIDNNKDGKLSLQELNAFSEEQANKPEQATQDSKPAQPGQHGQPGRPGPLFTAADKDHNGTLSRDELKDKPELYKDFDKIDADHDGKITPQEIDSYSRARSKPEQGQAKASK